jgi:hypothetical protein
VNSTNFICKDNLGESVSYCCPAGNKNLSCTRDFCTGNAITTSMKWYTCPYEQRTCGSTSSKLVAEYSINKTIEISPSLIKSSTICYWVIQAPSYKSINTTRIMISATRLQGINLYMTVGKTAGTASNEYLMNTLSPSLTFYFEPNLSIYVVAMAQDSTASLAFTYTLKDYSVPLPNCAQN